MSKTTGSSSRERCHKCRGVSPVVYGTAAGRGLALFEIGWRSGVIDGTMVWWCPECKTKQTERLAAENATKLVYRLTSRSDVYQAIDRERQYQDDKFGSVDQNPHNLYQWICILWEEVEEAVRAANADDKLRELVQAAAVIVACLEQHGLCERETMETIPKGEM